ncbi:hypothetical protein ABPG72_003114 [Tetrahymena utriculariae]
MQLIQYQSDNIQDILKKELQDYKRLEIYIKPLRENKYSVLPSLQYCSVILTNSNNNVLEKSNIDNKFEDGNELSTIALNLEKEENSDQILSQLISQLEKHKQIETLFLLGSYSKAGAKGFLDLASDLQKLNNITNIDIQLMRNIICEQGASEIGVGIAKFPNLLNLNLILKENIIGQVGAKNLGIGLGSCTKLTTFDLNLVICGIGTQGTIDLCIGLSKCQSLTTLILSLLHNHIGGDKDVKEGLGQGIAKFTNMSKLEIYLKNNSIGKNDALSLGQGLNQCTKLSTLKLYLDIISKKAISNLNDQISKSKNLSSFELNFDSHYGKFNKKDQLCSGIAIFETIVNCQHHNTHADDEDDVIFPPWKLRIVLRENGQSCYMYPDGCDFACYEDCVSYNGDNADISLVEYKYCCPRHQL